MEGNKTKWVNLQKWLPLSNFQLGDVFWEDNQKLQLLAVADQTNVKTVTFWRNYKFIIIFNNFHFVDIT